MEIPRATVMWQKQTAEHLIECPLLQQTTTIDLIEYNDRATDCVKQWIGTV